LFGQTNLLTKAWLSHKPEKLYANFAKEAKNENFREIRCLRVFRVKPLS